MHGWTSSRQSFHPRRADGGLNSWQVALFQYDLMDKLFVKDYEVGLKLINLMSQAVIKELTAFKRREHRQRLLALVGEDELVTSVPLQWEPLDLGGKMAAMTEFFDKFREKWGVGMFDEEMTEEEMVTLASLVKVATVEPGQLVVKAAAEAPVAYLILSGSLEKKQVDRLSFVDKSSVLSQRFAGDIAGAGIVMRELVGISNLEDEVDWYCGTETSSRVAVFSMEQAKFRELSDVVLMRLMINMGQISTAKLLETLQVTAAKCLSSNSLPLHTKWDTVHRSRRLSISEIEHVVQEANANAHRQKSVVQQEVQQAQGLVYGEDLSRQMTRAGAKGSLRHQDLSLLMKAVSASSRFWYGFTDHELHMLSQSMELVHAPKGEFVCQAGHESDFAGIVIQGYVNVVNVDDQVLATMYVGDGLAQTTYFHSGIDALGLVSMDDTLIAKISPHSLEMLKDRFPKIAQRAIKLFLQCTLTLLSEATLTFHESAKLTPKVMNQFALHNLLQKTAGGKRKAFKNDFSDLEIEKILQCMFICKVPKGAPMLVYGQEARIVGYIMDGAPKLLPPLEFPSTCST
jgi:CRP-like cAMP-binding protein